MTEARNPRDEAERLVATALAALSLAAQSTAGFATGSAECCVCPLCKAIAAARDPDPQFAERLASGVGDLATGVASVLRAFGSAGTGSAKGFGDMFGRGTQTEAPEPERAPAGDAEDVWRSATTGTSGSEPDD